MRSGDRWRTFIKIAHTRPATHASRYFCKINLYPNLCVLRIIQKIRWDLYEYLFSFFADTVFSFIIWLDFFIFFTFLHSKKFVIMLLRQNDSFKVSCDLSDRRYIFLFIIQDQGSMLSAFHVWFTYTQRDSLWPQKNYARKSRERWKSRTYA